MKNKIILITGKKFSGKDTTAERLVENYRYKRYAYADSLKNMAVKLVNEVLGGNCSISNFVDLDKKEKPIELPLITKKITPREILQAFGTNFVREYLSDSYWVDYIVNEINTTNPRYACITDYRFPNEFDEIVKNLSNKYDIFRIKVKRNSIIVKDGHSSENALNSLKDSDFDYILNNNKDFDYLNNQIDEMMLKLY
jgi:hypothetical protein